MIKYEIKTGSKTTNDKARTKRDKVYKPALKGMRCNCGGGDTIISIEEVMSTVLIIKPIVISACCEEFKTRVEAALKKAGRP